MAVAEVAGKKDERDDVRRGSSHVAYVMSRFPKLTETFVLYEMLALERLGYRISVYPLLRQRESVVHPEAERMIERARYLPFASLSIVASQLHFLRRRPRAYLATLATLVRANFGSLKYLAGALAIFPKVCHMARLALADGVEHVHCHFSSHPAAAGFIIHRLAGIPFSFTAHGSDLHLDRHMLREKVAEASFVVAVSEYNRQLILEECGQVHAAKTVVIHSGIDISFFAPRSQQAERTVGFALACVGQLAEVKGQAYLIEACRRLAAQGLDFICYMAGDGPLRRSLEQHVARAGLQGQVKFLGPLRRVEVADLLSRVDVLVAPSVPTAEGRREGIPVVIMEAMASGLAVVASRLSGIPELIEDGRNGLLVEPRDVDGLAGALRTLAADGDLKRHLGHAGRHTVEQDFDIRRTTERLAEQISRAASVPSSGGTEGATEQLPPAGRVA